MKIEKMVHTSLLVRDMDKAIKFFSEVLDLEFPEPWETPELDIRETTDAVGLINLVTPLSPTGVTGRELARRGERAVCICYKVPSVDEATAEMQAHGIRVIAKSVWGEMPWVAFDPRDTFGVMIEFVEYRAKNEYLFQMFPSLPKLLPKK